MIYKFYFFSYFIISLSNFVFKKYFLKPVLILIFPISFCVSCVKKENKTTEQPKIVKKEISVKVEPKVFSIGASNFQNYIGYLNNKNIALVVNHTATIGNKHLVDTLSNLNINIKKIFVPEHGFRGKADAGEHLNNSVDKRTGIPLISLYGKNDKKPKAKDLEDIDIMIFDIQDVGVRFYTYISTMHFVMEACAENNIPLIILDRPNPNGRFVDGPVRQKGFESFVGIHPIPILHGLTVGELALMINGEKWLKNGVQCELIIINNENYNHKMSYSLPIKPSPNLPNDRAIILYPSLCLFEGTSISVGRGTMMPFQIIGGTEKVFGEYTFIPKSIDGMSKYPKYQNRYCFGLDLREGDFEGGFTVKYLIDFYQKTKYKHKFFNNYFNDLAGNATLQQQIKAGMSEEDIRKTWETELKQYKEIRKKYLLYED